MLTEKKYFGHWCLGPEYMGQPDYNELLHGYATHHLLCANASVDTSGDASRDQLIQPNSAAVKGGQLAPIVPST